MGFLIIIFNMKNINNQFFMKNYFFITVMLGLLFMGCSVDNDETEF